MPTDVINIRIISETYSARWSSYMPFCQVAQTLSTWGLARRVWWREATPINFTLAGETVLQQCVTRFIDLAFCSRCVRATPPFCFNTCNALLRACYSPYYTALNRQYNQLWDVVQRTVQVANSTVQGRLTGESVILDIENIYSELQLFMEMLNYMQHVS